MSTSALMRESEKLRLVHLRTGARLRERRRHQHRLGSLDRICLQGKGDKPALLWEGSAGVEKRFTYHDIRRASNTIAAFLRELGINPGDRVCLFPGPGPRTLHRTPGNLKDRRHRPAAFLGLRG